MLKKFDEWNYRGATKKDQTEIKKWLKKDIPLAIDDIGGVHTEEGVYIANAVYDAENGVGIEMQNKRGGKREGAGKKKIVPADAKRKTYTVTEEEDKAIIELLEEKRGVKMSTMIYNFSLDDSGKVDGKAEWSGNFDEGYYCTNHEGDGLFWVANGERSQIAGTCDFSLKGLTEASAKNKIRKYLRK